VRHAKLHPLNIKFSSQPLYDLRNQQISHHPITQLYRATFEVLFAVSMKIQVF